MGDVDADDIGDAAPPPEEEQVEELKNPHTYPLVVDSELDPDWNDEIADFVTTACEKFYDNYEHAAKVVKETMDSRFGGRWNVIVGENYAYDCGYLVGTKMTMYTMGNIAILMWLPPMD